MKIYKIISEIIFFLFNFSDELRARAQKYVKFLVVILFYLIFPYKMILILIINGLYLPLEKYEKKKPKKNLEKNLKNLDF